MFQDYLYIVQVEAKVINEYYLIRKLGLFFRNIIENVNELFSAFSDKHNEKCDDKMNYWLNGKEIC